MRDTSARDVLHKLRESIALRAECHPAVRATEEYAAWQPGADNKDLRGNVPRRPHPRDSRWLQLPRERQSQPGGANPAERLGALAGLGATSLAWRMASLRFHPEITFHPGPLQTIPPGLPLLR